MNIEGRLSITLEISKTGIVPTITSSRPTQASALFAGKRAGQILEILPLLFNVCGKAQATAAVRAIESATGRTASAAIEQQRQTIVSAESLREHLWRILIDWRDLVGREIEQAALSKLTLSLTKLSQQLDPDSSLMSLEPRARKPDDIQEKPCFRWCQ